jgi:hypothetical protein
VKADWPRTSRSADANALRTRVSENDAGTRFPLRHRLVLGNAPPFAADQLTLARVRSAFGRHSSIPPHSRAGLQNFSRKCAPAKSLGKLCR